MDKEYKLIDNKNSIQTNNDTPKTENNLIALTDVITNLGGWAKPAAKNFIAGSLAIAVIVTVLLGAVVSNAIIKHHHNQSQIESSQELSELEKLRQKLFVKEHEVIINNIEENIDNLADETEELKDKVAAGHPVMGIVVQDTNKGVNVVEVNGKKAKKSGILPDDIIVSFNEIAVKNAKEISDMMDDYYVGDVVKIEVNRFGQMIEIELELDSVQK